MEYRILMRLRKTGNFYYFSHFDSKGYLVPRGVHLYRREHAALFGSIFDACFCIRKFDLDKYRCVVVPASISHLAEFDLMERLKEDQ